MCYTFSKNLVLFLMNSKDKFKNSLLSFNFTDNMYQYFKRKMPYIFLDFYSFSD